MGTEAWLGRNLRAGPIRLTSSSAEFCRPARASAAGRSGSARARHNHVAELLSKTFLADGQGLCGGVAGYYCGALAERDACHNGKHSDSQKKFTKI